ncbi:MAG: RlmE family RNA methyltransferase [Spirochaetia bacterium]|nr:RlmE family RNA methyltransferase [Spirochaetia bacterium]MCF7940896.1 RlmE family RNA methyltransferase [Spirochaetia bacterium]
MAKNRDQADHYTKRAKKEGYPARSVYKLEEIQQRFSIIRPGAVVLDIGAAPGSWTLYTQRNLLKGRGRIVAIDLKPLTLDPLPDRITFLQGDAFSPEIAQQVREAGPYDTIISDAAPATTGNRSVDTMRSQGLAESVTAFAAEHLKEHGNLVLKIFQGGGEQEVIRYMRTLFVKVKPIKPKACRNESFELFLVGLDRKAP